MLLSITPKSLANEISHANQRVYYSGAGIDTEVSDILIRSKQLNPSLEVIVVIDCTAHARRLGYGTQTSIQQLQQHKIQVFQQQGVRLSFCIVDQSAWVFSFPPQLVEGYESFSGFNCIELNANQIETLAKQLSLLIVQETTEYDLNFDYLGHVGNHLKPFSFLSMTQKLTNEQLMQLDQDLEQNPPQRFDVSRQVQVFNSRVEFVEVELIGGSIDRHVFKFPDEIKRLISDDAEAQKRLSASYKLIDSSSKVSSKAISFEVDSLRRKFLRPMGKLGRVMLRAQKDEFLQQINELENKIEAYKNELEKSLEGELKNSKKGLINALIERVKLNPPDELKFGIESKKATKAQAMNYLERLLDKYMPKKEDLLGAIELKYHFKAVTYEMLSDKEFQIQLKTQFPYVDWQAPLEEYTAAKGGLFDQL